MWQGIQPVQKSRDFAEVPVPVPSPAWMRTSPAGTLMSLCWLWVSLMQTTFMRRRVPWLGRRSGKPAEPGPLHQG